MLPFTFFARRTAVIIMPINASSTVIPSVWKVPASKEPLKENIPNRVESLFTTIFAFCRPIKVMNKPIPTDTACFKFIGMALKIASLTFVKESRIKIRPSTNTAANAICQVYPIPSTTVYAKYAFNPIPGASAKG